MNTSQLSKTYVLWFISLDWILHFFVGMGIFIWLRKKGVSFSGTCLILAVPTLSKEIYDSRTLKFSYLNSTVDIISTYTYPLIAWLTGRLKTNLADKETRHNPQDNND